MPKQNLKVYLDNHIKRENLLYKRVGKAAEEPTQPNDYLTIQNLSSNKSRLLLKPDFQRATWAWSPEECVDLLESVLSEQVVPSVIMWLSPENYQYVLDGGHRISVLLAWVRDNWGDRLTPDEYAKDQTLERESKRAAQRVRQLLKLKGIGTYIEFLTAYDRYEDLRKHDREPELEMDQVSLKYAKTVRRWEAVNMGFPILWVKGNYEKAEESFLKINKTGRRLSDWETKLVENRTSSFARAVISIAQVSDAEHCWPQRDAEISTQEDLLQKIREILQKVRVLHDLLFTPPYHSPISDLRQPLLAIQSTKPELKPAYLAEVLTITEGRKGQKPETESLIKRDKNAPARNIISNGLKLINNASDVISNIYGPSPRSMGLMPLVYFYSNQAIHVRSLLYGMLYWLNNGSENEDILVRKKIFTLYRKAFEDVLIRDKNIIIKRIARRIGSGAEVTYPTAKYYQGLLEILIKHKGVINSNNFNADHSSLIENLSTKRSENPDLPDASSSRIYTGNTKTGVHVKDFLKMFVECEICGGRYYPGLFTQIDHIKKHSEGGATSIDNGRNTHPFCNNNRDSILKLQSGELVLELPEFRDPNKLAQPDQMNFLNFFDDNNDTHEVIDEDDDYEEVDDDFEDEEDFD